MRIEFFVFGMIWQKKRFHAIYKRFLIIKSDRKDYERQRTNCKLLWNNSRHEPFMLNLRKRHQELSVSPRPLSHLIINLPFSFSSSENRRKVWNAIAFCQCSAISCSLHWKRRRRPKAAVNLSQNISPTFTTVPYNFERREDNFDHLVCDMKEWKAYEMMMDELV
jgi:hypothetical protein